MSHPKTEFNDIMKSLFSGFSKLSRRERLDRLMDMGVISQEDVDFLRSDKTMDITMAENFIENAIGYFQIPIGVAANFVVDDVAYAIPMAVEETSIVAAASKTAKWIRDHGTITTETIGESIIGQIQISKVENVEKLRTVFETHKIGLLKELNEVPAAGLVRRGGGVRDLQLRLLDRKDGRVMGVVHVYADVCDAMGANIINQICEYLKTPLQELTGETVTMCILSNLVDSRVTRATVRMRGLDAELMNKIEEASYFAFLDPYRAATNNKGVLNGIDPILIATGNDWRAVEAGIHAYAARDGQYRSITVWKREGDELVGVIEAPLVLGIVGGVTRLHPMAQMSLRMMGIQSADQLSRICAAVGLVQNLGALRALTTEGIIEGHMKLHIKNLAMGAGAKEFEAPFVQKKLEEVLALTKRISLQNAIEALKELRAKRLEEEKADHLPPEITP